jgi:hypothetical protein
VFFFDRKVAAWGAGSTGAGALGRTSKLELVIGLYQESGAHFGSAPPSNARAGRNFTGEANEIFRHTNSVGSDK